MTEYETVGAFGLTEPNSGSDNPFTETRAEHDGNTWILDGQKYWITNSTRADVASVLAKTGRRTSYT